MQPGDFGSTWLAPGKTGWPHPNTYLDLNGHRYTLIYAAADPPPKNVSVSVLGIEDVGDGTGALITGITEQYLHALKNWVDWSGRGTYQSGAWLQVPTFTDEPTLDRIDAASFTAAKAVLDARIALEAIRARGRSDPRAHSSRSRSGWRG